MSTAIKISWAYSGDANSTATILTTFQRGSIVLASPGTDVADAGYAALASDITDTKEISFDVDTFDAAGSADAGTFYGIALGYDTASAGVYSKRQFKVKCNDSKTRLLAFGVDSDGTVSRGIGDQLQAFR